MPTKDQKLEAHQEQSDVHNFDEYLNLAYEEFA